MSTGLKQFIKHLPGVGPVVGETYRLLFPRPVAKTTAALITEGIWRTLSKQPSVFFIQVGANDGLHRDPIHDLIGNNPNWKGIFIEPVRFLFERLRLNYANQDRFVFENVAVATEKGMARFYYVAEDAKEKLGPQLPIWYDQLGSFDRNHILKHLEGKLEPYIVETQVECVPLQEILDRNGVTELDLLHVDTEGFDYKVLAQVDFNRYRPRVVLYEHEHLSMEERQKAASLLNGSGYQVTQYEGDTLAIRNTLAPRGRSPMRL